ncbi:MAG: TrbC family F-type conjugative pilus assembly protein [Actinomycetota bacterium]
MRTRLVLLSSLLLLPPVAAAEEGAIHDGRDGALQVLEHQGDALARGAAMLDPNDVAVDPTLEGPMPDILDALAPETSTPATAGVVEILEPAPPYLLLLSAAMAGDALREALRSAAEHGLAVRFRGLLPGEDLVAFAVRLHALTENLAAKPDIALDPRPFRHHGITEAPTLLDVRTGAFLRGATDPRDLTRRDHGDRRPDLGHLGSTVPVVERDLVTVIQERLEALDLEARLEAAKDRYGKNFVDARLPHATGTRIRQIDPTVVLRTPLAVGEQLYPAGFEVNPLHHMPGRLRVVVIDATDAAQVEHAATLLDPSVPTTVVSDRLASWREHLAAEQRLRRRIHLLTRRIADRLGLEAVPSVVEVAGDRLVVTEHVVEADP